MADFQLSDAQRQVDEGTTKQFQCTLLAEDGTTVLPDASIVSITLSLWWVDRGQIKRTVNSRNGQNIHNANNGTFGTTSGILDIYFQPADTTIQNPDQSVKSEEHHFRIDWTYSSSNGDRTGQYRDFFIVRRKPTQV